MNMVWNLWKSVQNRNSQWDRICVSSALLITIIATQWEFLAIFICSPHCLFLLHRMNATKKKLFFGLKDFLNLNCIFAIVEKIYGNLSIHRLLKNIKRPNQKRNIYHLLMLTLRFALFSRMLFINIRRICSLNSEKDFEFVRSTQMK